MGISIKKEHSITYTNTYGVEFSIGYVTIVKYDSRNGYSGDSIQIPKEDWPSFLELISKANDILIRDDKKEGE